MRTAPCDVLVVSPHLDDAVLSLATFISRSTRAGRRVEVLTVFAGEPTSTLASGGWDRRGGFATEGEASRARRLEDEEGCALVGAEPRWLSFSEADYRSAGIDEAAVGAALADAVSASSADLVLGPGFPLTNPDHAAVHALLARAVAGTRLGLYAEQPYRYAVRTWQPRPELPPADGLGGAPWPRWRSVGATPADLRRKRRAIAAYHSQMPLLGFTESRHRKLRRMLLHEALHRGEAIAAPGR